MITVHFFKTLVLFAIMLGMGLVGIFLASHFDQAGEGEETAATPPCETGRIC